MLPTWSTPTRTRLLGSIALAAVLVHAPVLGGGLVWLDHAHLTEGLALPEGGVAQGDWLTLFTRGFAGTGFYRPLVALSLSIDATLGGSPFLFHAVTLTWHALCAALVFLAGEALGLTRRASVVAGLTFAVHPLTSLVAGAIAFRSESMATVALLLVLIAHVERRPVLAGLALLAGALTKETALVLAPLSIVGWELSRVTQDEPDAAETSRASRRRLFAYEAAALCSAVALRWAFAPAWRAQSPELSLAEAIATRLASLEKSFATLFLLGDRSVGDAFPVVSWSSPHAVAGGVLALCVLYLAYQRRGIALLFALALLPSLQLVPVMRWWSPHYLYTPLAFAALLWGELLDQLTPSHAATEKDGSESAAHERRLWQRPLVWGSVLLAGCAALSCFDAFRFRSDETLWSREVKLHPECREAHFYLGEAARASKRFDVAADHYQRAVATTPDYLSYVDLKAAYANLGVAHLEQHRPTDALVAFRAALSLAASEQEHRQLSHDVATAALMSGDALTAARELEAETSRPDALPASLFVRARALSLLGRTADARALEERLAALSRVH